LSKPLRASFRFLFLILLPIDCTIREAVAALGAIKIAVLVAGELGYVGGGSEIHETWKHL
jgi:hypothetical protein